MADAYLNELRDLGKRGDEPAFRPSTMLKAIELKIAYRARAEQAERERDALARDLAALRARVAELEGERDRLRVLRPMSEAPTRKAVDILVYDDHGNVSLVHRTLQGWTCSAVSELCWSEDGSETYWVRDPGPYTDDFPRAIGWLPVAPHPSDERYAIPDRAALAEPRT